MFSSRFHWDLRPNRIARLLEEKRRSAVPVMDLTESNPTHAGFDYPYEIRRAFEDDRILRYDPQAAGMMEARAAVARYYAERSIPVEPERILLTASTSGAAVALHSQPLELPWLREFIRAQLSHGAYPHLVLRIGLVTQVAVSVRREPHEVLFQPAHQRGHRDPQAGTQKGPVT